MPKIEPQGGAKWNEEDRLKVADVLLKIGYAVQICKVGEKGSTYAIEYAEPNETRDKAVAQ